MGQDINLFSGMFLEWEDKMNFVKKYQQCFLLSELTSILESHCEAQKRKIPYSNPHTE